MTNKHPYSFLIPDHVHDMNLDPFEFRVYCHLKRCHDNNESPEGIRQLAECCNMSTGSVSRAQSALAKKGLLAIDAGLYPAEAEHRCRHKRPQNLCKSILKRYIKTCEWCNGETIVLHRHHHPIPKSEGGTETVSICPNCHSEFHALVTDTYSLTPLAIGITDDDTTCYQADG